MQRLVVVVYLSDGAVVVFVSGAHPVSWLLASDLINPRRRLPMVDLQLALPPVPIHQKTVLVLPTPLEHLLGSGNQPVAIPDVVLM